MMQIVAADKLGFETCINYRDSVRSWPWPFIESRGQSTQLKHNRLSPCRVREVTSRVADMQSEPNFSLSQTL